MPIRELVTRGYGNGSYEGTIFEIVTRGFTINRFGTSNLRTVLIENESLNAIVGERIYRGKLPDNPVYPCILYKSAEEPEETLSGSSFLVHKLYEFEIYGDNYTDLEEAAFQLRSAMNDAPFESVLKDLNDEQYADDPRVFSIFLDYSVWQ